jgi:hypothetical protein
VVEPVVEPVAATAFSFLRGASHAEELVAAAAALGLSALGIADRNSVAGVVRRGGRRGCASCPAAGWRCATPPPSWPATRPTAPPGGG